MNEHSPKFEMVKTYYETGQWSKKAVKNAVVRPVGRPYITTAEYEEIVGESYEL